MRRPSRSVCLQIKEQGRRPHGLALHDEDILQEDDKFLAGAVFRLSRMGKPGHGEFAKQVIILPPEFASFLAFGLAIR